MEATLQKPPTSLDIEKIALNINNRFILLGRAVVDAMLEVGEEAWKVWEYFLDESRNENPNAYIRKTQSKFKQWRELTGHPSLLKLSMNFHQWYKAIPQQYQKDALDIKKWSFSALGQLAKMPFNLAKSLIEQGKQGIRHTVKSIKCIFDGCGQKYLERNQLLEQADWQFIQEKLKMSDDTIAKVQALTEEKTKSDSEFLQQATVKAKANIKTLLLALEEMGYEEKQYKKLFKPEKKKYTDSYVQKLEIEYQKQIDEQEQEYQQKLAMKEKELADKEQEQKNYYQKQIDELQQQIYALTKETKKSKQPKGFGALVSKTS